MGKPIRYLVNDRCLFAGRSGIPIYLEELWRHWPRNSDVELTGCCGALRKWCRLPSRRASQASWTWGIPLKELLTRVCPDKPAGYRTVLHDLYRSWFKLQLRYGAYDGYFEPNNLAFDIDIPIVTTLHDLSVIEHPEWHPPERVARWEKQFNHTLRATSHWIVPSHFTKQRLIAVAGVPEDRISAIPLAPRNMSVNGGMGALPDALRGCFLHLGTIEPRKNILMLLSAYGRLPAELRERHRLVLVGAPGWGSDDFWTQLREHPMSGEAIAIAGASDDQVATILSGAMVLLCASHYEGFGLPVVEAMAAGVPVVRTSIPVMEEVAGSASLTVSGEDASEWSRIMVEICEDATLRQSLSERGRARALATYAWSSTAEQHMRALGAAARRR